MKLRKLAVVPAVAALAAAGLLPLNAAANPYTINLGNSGGLAPYTGPYATAEVSLLDSTNANVTFNSLTNGGYLYLLGAAHAVDLNVNAASWSTLILGATNSVWGGTPGPISNAGEKGVDGFGTFNQTYDSDDGFTTSSTQISVSLTRTDGGSWSTAASVLTPNASGNFLAIHGFACPQATCSLTSGVTETGYATVGAIPEPETYAMLLAGLGLMGFVARRRKQQAA